MFRDGREGRGKIGTGKGGNGMSGASSEMPRSGAGIDGSEGGEGSGKIGTGIGGRDGAEMSAGMPRSGGAGSASDGSAGIGGMGTGIGGGEIAGKSHNGYDPCPMGVVNYTCESCGERCSDDRLHACPGSDGDRLCALEEQVARLKEIVAVLLTGRALPADDVRAFCEDAGVELDG